MWIHDLMMIYIFVMSQKSISSTWTKAEKEKKNSRQIDAYLTEKHIAQEMMMKKKFFDQKFTRKGKR